MDRLQMQGTDIPPQTLWSIFRRFLTFGLLAWGGPMAQIAMIRRELVDEEQWLSPARFNHLLAVYQALPGPEAHELCVHLGMMARGRIGGLLAGLGFMLPGFVLMLLLAWAYGRLDLTRPLAAAALLGVQIGVIALIVRAVHRIGVHVIVNRHLLLIGVASALATFAGAPFWIVLPCAAVVYSCLGVGRYGAALAAIVTSVLLAYGVAGPAAASEDARNWGSQANGLLLFWVGLKAGMLTFGGAYTAIPFVRDAVVGRGWMSDGQFLDGIALSGIIPAPLIIFATFVGYQAGGLVGALAITAGVFLPAFGFTLLFFDRLERAIENERLRRLLDGIAAGVIGVIASTAVQLAMVVTGTSPMLAPTITIFLAALALLYAWKSKANVVAVIVCSAVAGGLAFA